MKKQAIIYAFLAGTAFIVPSCAPAEETKENTTKDASYPKVEVAEVKDTTFVHRIRVQGNVETDEDVLITAEMGGLITNVNVKEGQKVSKGTVIATVDASVLASNMEELRTQLNYAQYMLDKQEELSKRGVGSEFDLETAKNQVKSLESKMASLSTQQGKAVIRAPFSGTIDQVYAVRGQMAGPQAPVVRLVNIDQVDIVATVSEKHFKSIQKGTKMSVSFPNYSDTVIEMEIENVGNYIEPTNRTFRIKSTIKNNDYFLPNMLAEISITDLYIEKGTVIPAEAILIDQESNDYVYILVPSEKKSGKMETKKVIVNVKERYEGNALIKSGQLKAGTPLVVKGARGVSNATVIETTK